MPPTPVVMARGSNFSSGAQPFNGPRGPNIVRTRGRHPLCGLLPVIRTTFRQKIRDHRDLRAPGAPLGSCSLWSRPHARPRRTFSGTSRPTPGPEMTSTKMPPSASSCGCKATHLRFSRGPTCVERPGRPPSITPGNAAAGNVCSTRTQGLCDGLRLPRTRNDSFTHGTSGKRSPKNSPGSRVSGENCSPSSWMDTASPSLPSEGASTGNGSKMGSTGPFLRFASVFASGAWGRSPSSEGSRCVFNGFDAL